MNTESKRQWWQHLGGMSQGMLFLHGHFTHPDPDPLPPRKHHVHDAAGKVRHRKALERLGARRLRAMTSLSLFR